MPKKDLDRPLTPEEREVVDFFKGFIPIIRDAFADLKRRNLLDEEFFEKSPKKSYLPKNNLNH